MRLLDVDGNDVNVRLQGGEGRARSQIVRRSSNGRAVKSVNVVRVTMLCRRGV